jgi:hypothetical protein
VESAPRTLDRDGFTIAKSFGHHVWLAPREARLVGCAIGGFDDQWPPSSSERVRRFDLHERTRRLSSLSSGSGRGH